MQNIGGMCRDAARKRKASIFSAEHSIPSGKTSIFGVKSPILGRKNANLTSKFLKNRHNTKEYCFSS